MFYCANENAERIRLKLKSIASLVVRPLWKNVWCVRQHSVLRFQGDAAICWYFVQGTLVTAVCHAETIAPFLVLALTWNSCSGKPSPESLPKQYSPPDSDLGCLMVTHNVMFGSMNDIFTFFASGGVRRCAILLQRPLVILPHLCTDAVTLSQKPSRHYY